MKLKIFIVILLVSLAAFIAVSQIINRSFAPAEDFPREALVYVEIADLPAFVRLWNESEFKEKYLTSVNFIEFKNRHLGLKLASRWKEFSEASGFAIDLEAVSGLAQNKAAVALYDIGKIEFVFIAPVSDEVFAASRFVQNQTNFEAETLGDGTIIYRKAVEADRGRQKQELIFTNVKGRFILATSEKLLAQTLGNINRKSAKNRLLDEPSFKALREKSAAAQTASVWVNQAALNKDYYFKRYWLMSGVKELENIRAGIFDFSTEDGKLIERRKFLLNRMPNPQVIKSVETLAHLPENIPFYRLRAADNQTVDGAIRETISDRRKDSENESDSRHYPSYDLDDFSRGVDYESLNGDFDETIDAAATDEEETTETGEATEDFSKFLQSARPQTVLTFTEPQLLPAPLFVEFRRAAIFNLASPGSLNRDAFEAAIEKNIAARVLISAPDARLKWETKRENDIERRELKLPLLGWEISYALRGDDLILTSSADFLREIAATKIASKSEAPVSRLTELTVLNLERKDDAYTQIFDELAGKNAADNFFTGNVESLLETISSVGKIEIKKYYSRGFLEEEITLILK